MLSTIATATAAGAPALPRVDDRSALVVPPTYANRHWNGGWVDSCTGMWCEKISDAFYAWECLREEEEAEEEAEDAKFPAIATLAALVYDVTAYYQDGWA